ncbi:MAG TPA: hypothetical protein VIX42_03305 [Edaphobacter sp.]
MTRVDWSLVETAAQLLERDEREAVLGDLIEAGEDAWRGLADVAGLVVRRQAGLWKSWRPWLVAFGLALPGSLSMMGSSLSVSWKVQHLMSPNGAMAGAGFMVLLCNVLLLIGWAWTGGFVVGSVSRRTVWVSVLACFSPCLFCLTRFKETSLSRFCLLLFLVPAIWGVCRGWRMARIRLSTAMLLAVAITVLMIPTWHGRGAWIFNWALIWPTWYLVATARRSDELMK